MILKKVLQNIINHPLNKRQKINAIFRFLKWQINVKINPYPIIYSYGEKSKLIIKKGLTGATGNLYCGLHEFEDMAFVLHVLTNDDLFVDIGANIGSYTILASSEKGAKTISIEPIPQTYKILSTNVLLNKVQNNVKCLNIGIGSGKAQLKFTKNLDTVNHVVSSSEEEAIVVEVDSFDNLISLSQSTLVKIDVEGFETEVINGMANALQSNYLKALIIELNGAGKRYGFSDDDIHNKLLTYNFKAYEYNPFDRVLKAKQKPGTHNTIYIKDLDFIENRIKNAKLITINKNSF